jgi:hypothetical protein
MSDKIIIGSSISQLVDNWSQLVDARDLVPKLDSIKTTSSMNVKCV